MARYIDLDKVEFLKVGGNEEFNHGVDCCINKLLETEPADVVERSKIDKGIEEITKLRNSTNRMITEEDTLVNECYKQYVNCFDECLKIVKQAIEE